MLVLQMEIKKPLKECDLVIVSKTVSSFSNTKVEIIAGHNEHLFVNLIFRLNHDLPTITAKFYFEGTFWRQK